MPATRTPHGALLSQISYILTGEFLRHPCDQGESIPDDNPTSCGVAAHPGRPSAGRLLPGNPALPDSAQLKPLFLRIVRPRVDHDRLYSTALKGQTQIKGLQNVAKPRSSLSEEAEQDDRRHAQTKLGVFWGKGFKVKMERAAGQAGVAAMVSVVPAGADRDPPVITELPRSAYADGAKRLVDIVITLLLAPLIAPLVAVCALVVMTDGHNPFFAQERVGRNGRIYRMWKLRSMVPNARAALDAHLAADPVARAEWDRHQKLLHDPRITQFGRIMRAFSLDELPQFWNVLRGDMSLVGPRPMLPEQMSLYPGHAYYALRPGLTGPWQVSDRHASSFADRARYDDFYAERMSLRFDLGLVLATIGVVLRGTGC